MGKWWEWLGVLHFTGLISAIYLFAMISQDFGTGWTIATILFLLHVIGIIVFWSCAFSEGGKEQIKRACEQTREEERIRFDIDRKRLQREKDEAIQKIQDTCDELESDFDDLKERYEAYKKIIESKSNLKTFPWMASVMADVMTYDIHLMELQLSWGDSIERRKKVRSLIELRKETAEQLESAKMAQYQLSYLLELYPSLQDVLDAEYEDIKFDLSTKDYAEQDPVRRYLSNEEWKKLSATERNQRALDNYIERRKKSRWQIGRDYELSIAFRYEKKGYIVERFGSEKGVEDLGRDLIAKKKGKTLLIQCKYWSKEKVIHEKHICQLFGTMMEFCFANNYSTDSVAGVFITSTTLSDMAKKFAEHLHIEYRENVAFEEFPRIKCNIGKDENGKTVKIYHLPMDLNYDKTKIEKKGEMWAYTVSEAEENGFRRAYKWHGDQPSVLQ